METQGFASSLLEAWSEKSQVKVYERKKSDGFYSKPQPVGLSKTLPTLPDVSRNKVMFERIKVLGEVSNNLKTKS